MNTNLRRISSWPWLLVAAMIVTVILAVTCRSSTNIHGRVILKGKPPLERNFPLDKQTSRLRPEGMLTRFYGVSKDGGLPNVVVHVLSAPTPIPCAPTPPLAVMEIRRGQIEPYVLAIQTNQLLAFRNTDPLPHNAGVNTHPSNGNKNRNYAMMPAPPVKPKTLKDRWRQFWDWMRGRQQSSSSRLESLDFPFPEMYVRIKCDVHPWELGYVCVFDHAGFAVTDADGRYQLPQELPAGRYVLEARHRKLGTLTNEIILGAGERKAVDFTFQSPEK